jgi:hypothetical protein
MAAVKPAPLRITAHYAIDRLPSDYPCRTDNLPAKRGAGIFGTQLKNLIVDFIGLFASCSS